MTIPSTSETDVETTRHLEHSSSAPWLFVLPAILLLITALAAVWRKVELSEVFFHLKAGQVIFKNQQLPNRDIFSATSSVGMWVYFEWLWGFALASTWQMADWLLARSTEWIGINALGVLIAALLVWLALVRCRRYGARWFESLIVVTLVIVGLLPVFQPTPGIAALPVFVLSLLLAEATRKRWPMILYPAIAALWANINIGAPMVLLVPIARAVFPDSSTAVLREPITRKFFLMVAAAGAIGLLIVPHSFRIYSAWFHAGLISLENIGTNLSEAFGTPFYWLRLGLAGVFFAFSMGRRALSKWQILTAVILLLLSFVFDTEMINFLLVFLSAPMALAVSGAMESTWSRPKILRNLAASGLLVVCIAWAAIAVTVGGITPDAWGTGVRPGKFPEMAAGRLSALPMRATVLNRREDAGYFIWRLWPGWKTAIDYRPGIYDGDFLEQYAAVWRGEQGWEAMFSLWRVQAVLGDRAVFTEAPGSNLYTRLASSDDWSAVYWDSDYILYVKSNIDLTNSNLSAFRQLKPGLTWAEQEARVTSPLQWQELAADLRRALLDDPMNTDAQEFLRRAESRS